MRGLDPRIQTTVPLVLDGRVKPGHEVKNIRHREERSDEAIHQSPLILGRRWIASLHSQ
jgi:hypothetical protein